MKKSIEWIKENRLVFFVCLISVLAAFAPYIGKDLVTGSDDTFHLIRIETLATALSRREFPVKFHSDLCYGYGYGVGFFYSNLFLYIPAILINLGFSLEVAYKLFAGMVLLATFGGMFGTMYRIVKNKYISCMAATMYTLSVSVLENFYEHFATSRCLAMIFLPAAIGGMYLLLKANEGKRMLVLGFSGLIYSHVLTTVLAVIVCIVLVVAYLKDWIGDRKKWKGLIWSVIWVCVFTAAFWIPMVEQWLGQKYKASIPWTYVDENVIPVLNLFSDQAVGRLLLGSVVIMGCYLTTRPFSKDLKVFLWTGIGFWGITAVYPFWHLFRNVFKFLQFPYRLFGIATVLFAMAFALWIWEMGLNKKWLLLVLSLVLAIHIGYAYQYMQGRTRETMDLGNTILHDEIAGLGAGEEWLPIQTTREMLTIPLEAKTADGISVGGEKNGNCFQFIADAGVPYYDLPLIWYKGFEALTENGEKLKVSQNPENGMVRVFTDMNTGGEQENAIEDQKITVYYKGTLLQVISYIATVIGVFGWSGYGIFQYITKKKEKVIK